MTRGELSNIRIEWEQIAYGPAFTSLPKEVAQFISKEVPRLMWELHRLTILLENIEVDRSKKS